MIRSLKIIVWCCVFALLGQQLVSAQTYGNEWINFSKNYYKVKVPKTGLYRITYQALSTAPGLPLSSLQGSRFNLFHNGEVVPIYVTTSGTFGSSDYIEFYGEKNDGTFDEQLYDDANWHMNPYYSMFNDTAVYYLTWDTPEPVIPITNVANDLTSLPTKEAYCTTTLIDQYNGQYQQGNYASLVGSPLYESRYEEGEGYCGVEFNLASKTFSESTTGFYSSSNIQCDLKLYMVSTSSAEHHIQVNFNTLAQLKDTTYQGFRLNKWEWNFPADKLLTTNVLSISASGSGASDRNAVSLVELTYPNAFNFQGRSQFNFTLNGAVADKYLEINNFNTGGTAPILYDLTNHMRIVGTPGANPVKFKLPRPNLATNDRELFLTNSTASEITNIFNVELVNFTNYANPINQGDYIIITNSKLLNDGGGNNWVSQYAQHRATALGGGYSPTIILIDQLYDQFAYGIRKHPQAIRNFLQYALDKWLVEPKFVFIIGKGREYANGQPGLNMRINAATYAQCLVPTFGFPGGDNLLSAPPGSLIPQIPTGRLSASNGNDVRIYLQKVIDYETEQSMVGDPYQTVANKLWTKKGIHLGGGDNQTEQSIFRYYLNSYQDIANDTLYGAKITSLFKSSSNPIQIAESGSITNQINDGVSFITFFGHSSPNSFDFSIDDPDNYQNYKRYPIILSNGCFSGNIFNPDPGVSEDFVFAEDKGAIAFVATTALSSSIGLQNFSENFYRNFVNKKYNQPLGVAIQNTIADVESCCNSSFSRMVAQDMTLHGDPALIMNTHDQPDYDLEPQLVYFSPSNVTVEQDSFVINVIVTNLGKAIDRDIDLEVTRTLPDGTAFTYTKTVHATYFQDTIPVTIQTGGNGSFGLNSFVIKIDAGDQVKNELSETNNTLGVTLNILSEDVFPIYPYEFAIVPNQGVTLKASTANAFADTKTYVVEIDTTELFNSPLKLSTTVTQSGGVIEWTPGMMYQDSVVYYWRVGTDSAGAGANKWRYSSFIYLDGSFPGWNQSHYYQYLKDDYQNMQLPTSRVFEFADDNKTIAVKTGTWDGYGGALPFDQIAYYLNNVKEQLWNCGGSGGFSGGITFAVFNPNTGQNWISKVSDKIVGPYGYSENRIYHSIHCKSIDVGGFMFPVNQSYYQNAIVSFLDSVPNGYYVLAYSVNNAGYSGWSTPMVNAFEDLGAQAIPTLQNQSGYSPWIFFAQKGDTTTAEEVYGNSINDVLDFNTTIHANWYEGKMKSPAIGPAFSWGSAHWRYSSLENPTTDSASVDIIGIDNNGVESVLMEGVTASDFSLQSIDAAQYPLIKLRLNTRDETTRTPAQLDYWRILYQKVPEAALNPAIGYQFSGDSIDLGETLSLQVAVTNVTELDMDSLLVKYTVVNSSNAVYTEYQRYDSLKAFQTMNISFQFNTNCNCLSDINSIIVEVNPDDDQPEQFHFNNIGVLQFKMNGDNANPLLDVTFDGVHILDGDIVSAEPEIRIKLKDENKYLALDDTSLVNVFVQYPDGSLDRLNFSDPDVQFIPVPPSQVSKNNTAEILINKRFEQDGTYELLVQAQDKSANISGTYGNASEGIDYRIQFEIVNKSTISNVLTYPNPFTSSTRFVFTLTGSQIPTFFKIQIMTVSGKVVREIMLDELGPIHIGNNITDFAWDGTDQYGDPLANGLYLYRVVVSIDGQNLESLDTGTNRYFKSGIGKIYLAR